MKKGFVFFGFAVLMLSCSAFLRLQDISFGYCNINNITASYSSNNYFYGSAAAPQERTGRHLENTFIFICSQAQKRLFPAMDVTDRQQRIPVI